MISKELQDHSLFLLKTLGDSLIWPKQVFATEQSMGSWVINRVYNFLVLCLKVSSWDLVQFLHPSVEYQLTLSADMSVDRVLGCTNYTRSIVGEYYCMARQEMAAGETIGCLSGPETLNMGWMFAVHSGLEQGSEMNGFCLKQGQGLKASIANPYPNFHKCPPPPPGNRTVSYFVLISSSL